MVKGLSPWCTVCWNPSRRGFLRPRPSLPAYTNLQIWPRFLRSAYPGTQHGKRFSSPSILSFYQQLWLSEVEIPLTWIYRNSEYRVLAGKHMYSLTGGSDSASHFLIMFDWSPHAHRVLCLLLTDLRILRAVKPACRGQGITMEGYRHVTRSTQMRSSTPSAMGHCRCVRGVLINYMEMVVSLGLFSSMNPSS